MKKILFAVFVLAAYTSYGQMCMGMHSYMKGDSSFSVSTYKNIGVSFLKFDGLNDRIKENPQFEEMQNVMGTLGIGSMAQHGHMISVMSLNLGYGMSGKKDEKSSSIGFLGLAADFGYNFFKNTSRVELYPTIGLGLEGYRARFNKDVSGVDFDAVLESNATQNNIRSLTFTNGYFTYRFGLNVGAKSKDQSCAVGLQAGYTRGFTGSSWKVNEYQSLQNAPSDNVSRFYTALYFTKKMNWGHKK